MKAVVKRVRENKTETYNNVKNIKQENGSIVITYGDGTYGLNMRILDKNYKIILGGWLNWNLMLIE